MFLFLTPISFGHGGASSDARRADERGCCRMVSASSVGRGASFGFVPPSPYPLMCPVSQGVSRAVISKALSDAPTAPVQAD